MLIVWGWLTNYGNQKYNEVSAESATKSARMSDELTYNNYWFYNGKLMKKRYWSASFMVPVASFFVLAFLIFLMVLFKRCPALVIAIVSTILIIICIFMISVTVSNLPIYE